MKIAALFGTIYLGCTLFFPVSATNLRHLQTPDEDTPAEEETCDSDSFTGESKGLCIAFCEAKDCEDEDAEARSTSCQNLLDNFKQLNSGDNPPCLCFPKDSSVEVEGKGVVSMETLQLGDRVRTVQGFSEVYAFGTRTLEGKNEFLKLTTASSHSIEMTGSHMVFEGESMTPKLASEVRVGDKLMLMPQKELHKVDSVEVVKRAGAVHPLTHEGSIVVNGIVASVHGVDSDVFVPVAKLGQFYLLDKHQFQQVFLSPLRVLCKISQDSFCSKKNHWNDGAHHLFDVLEHILIFLMPESVSEENQTAGQEANFFEPTVFLPVKTLLLSWMFGLFLFEALIENIYDVMTILAVSALVAYITRLVVYTTRDLKLKVKQKDKTI